MRPEDGTLEPLLYHLADFGTRPALVQMRGRDAAVCSYAELDDAAARFAEGVRRSGIAKGATAALFAVGGPEWIIGCLGLIRAGAVPVPLDAQLDEQTLRHVLTDCKAHWALTDKEHLPVLESCGYSGRILLLDADEDDQRSWRRWLAENAGQAPRPAPDDTAVLFYTSGTTGPPKGVPLRHSQLAFQLQRVAAAGLVRDDERVLQPLPLHHVYPLVVGTLAPLALGLRIVLPEAMMGPQLLAAIREQKVSFIIGVPRLYAALLDGIELVIEATTSWAYVRPGSSCRARSTAVRASGIGGRLLRKILRFSVWSRRHLGLRLGKVLLYPLHRRLGTTLRVLASGGAALEPAVAWQLEGLGWRVAVGYGLTETSPLLTLKPPGGGHIASVGRPLPGIDLRIERVQQEEPQTALLRDGEILARGPGVFAGYLGHERDAAVFTADGWFRTGDLGYVDKAGYLFVTGRKNTMIVTSSGKNIRPEELEEHYAMHPFIEEIGVCAAPDGLAAVVVPAREEIQRREVSTHYAIRRAIADASRDLPSYKRIVRFVVSTEPLARTRLGKIQRHRLKERYEALLRSVSGESDEQTAGSPISLEDMAEADRKLLENDSAYRVWDLLSQRYPNRHLTPDTNVQLDLNVDSLGWLELSAEISRLTGITLDEQLIVSIDSVRDLLRCVAETAPRGSAVLGISLEEPESTLRPAQKRWLEPLPPATLLASRGLLGLNRLAMRGLFKLRLHGIERLDADTQVIITPNHTSFLDALVVAAALPRPVLEKTYWGGWTGYAFRNVLFRTVSRLSRVVPIDPDRAAMSSLAFAAAILKRGNNLVWFPEGERSASGELLEFRPGLGMVLAHFTTLTVLPVHIEGAYEAWPRDKQWPRLHPISATFGKPVLAAELAERGRGETPRARSLNALYEVMERLGAESATVSEP